MFGRSKEWRFIKRLKPTLNVNYKKLTWDIKYLYQISNIYLYQIFICQFIHIYMYIYIYIYIYMLCI